MYNRIQPLASYLAPLIQSHSPVKIADLGAGPFSRVGTTHAACEVLVTASDMLADEYMHMLDEGRIIPVVPCEKQDMEALTYPDDSFDIVHCANALDHTENPLAALKEMYRICAPGGWIHMRHYPNQGVAHHYRGMHQWNISADGRIWNASIEYSIAEIYPFTTTIDGKYVISEMRKCPGICR